MKTLFLKKYINLLIIIASATVLAVSYFAVYKAENRKTSHLQSKIVKFQPELMQLREYDMHEEQYLDDIKEYKKNIKETLPEIPSSVLTEDQIALVSQMEKDLGITVTSETFADPVETAHFKGVTSDSIDDPEKTVDMTADKNQMTITSQMEYPEFRNFLDYVYKEKGAAGLDSVSLTYDAGSSLLDISAVISRYTLSYSGAPEREQTLPEVTKGVDEPFGTYKTPDYSSHAELG